MVEQEVRARRGSAGTWLLATLLLSGCAATRPFEYSTDFDRVFINAAQTWDLNKDGVVTCDEWKQYVTTAFHEADANGDGVLDAQEFSTLVRGDRLFEVADLKYFDANGDGRVTLDEMTSKPNPAFRLLDKNNDCKIDRNESVQMYSVDKPKEKEPEMPRTH